MKRNEFIQRAVLSLRRHRYGWDWSHDRLLQKAQDDADAVAKVAPFDDDVSPGDAAADAEHAGKVREMMVALHETRNVYDRAGWESRHRVLLDEIAAELAKG